MKLDETIVSFIQSQKNLTLATANKNIPHCASCFYAYMSDGNYVIFKSDKETQHISNAINNVHVAGSILPDIEKVGTLKGIQFTGKFKIPDGDFLMQVKNVYYTKYPFARLIDGDLWVVELEALKMTNNVLGIGKKLLWEKTNQITKSK